jgi:NAD(P)-dependent dehydrogenase (short-subunit alcohol dehydrogenase family)
VVTAVGARHVVFARRLLAAAVGDGLRPRHALSRTVGHPTSGAGCSLIDPVRPNWSDRKLKTCEQLVQHTSQPPLAEQIGLTTPGQRVNPGNAGRWPRPGGTGAAEARMSGFTLITGGARGIGAATARAAAAAGRPVVVNFRERADAAEALVGELTAAGARATAIRADVGVEADVVRLFDEAERWGGAVRGLVNSAGVGGGHARVDAFDAGTLIELMRVNVVGTMLCCREAARRMSTEHGGRGGAVVNVSSMAGTIGGRPGSSAYAASKAAVDSFTVGFAKEVASAGIRVNAVRPGVTLTDMTERVRADEALRRTVAASIPMGRVAEAEEIAAPIVWLLSDEASFIAGCLLDASGGGFVIGASTS